MEFVIVAISMMLDFTYFLLLINNFEKKFKNFDSSSLSPCKVELQQHSLRVRHVTKFWRNAHLKYPTSLSPLACGWTMNDNKYDFVWFLGDQLPSLVADIIVQDSKVLENNDIPEDNSDTDESNDHNVSSDDDDDLEDALF
ncbi:unnamed protein product [Psylliodes chrysocephalus]|uniref:Uncharacterized protein n=1 Tax=Psylliodes chrysocephalus TaxID=3402493 RepID=A0A9P0D6P9_9CUCU|nr:unnamed protein product [Psylliodes chrysocephala]